MERIEHMVTKDGLLMEVPTTNYAKTKTCRSCHSSNLEEVLFLGDQFLPRWVDGVDMTLPKAPLKLVMCERCHLLQLGHTVDSDLLFKNYWYRSSVNQTMRSALDDVVHHGLGYHKEGAWLDIGANDGYLLSQVPKGFRKLAYEPALDFYQGLKDQKIDHVVNDYFRGDVPFPCDVITSCAMFYDLDNPHRFVEDVAKALAPDGVWINQLNDAPGMLRMGDFSAICHEHLTYWDLHQLEELYRQHGLTITRVTWNDVNGGSARVVARKSTRQREDLLGIPKTDPDKVRAFAKRTVKWKTVMQDMIDGVFWHGGAYCYGASTKGCVMLQYVDPNGVFKGIADRNPLKHGLQMAGVWAPIVSEDEFRAAKPRWALVLPYAFRDEFDRREVELRAQGTTFVYPFPDISFVL